jgi:hypothetical protein
MKPIELNPYGWDQGTVDLIFAIEQVTRQHGLARAQQALASALWRATARHPSFAMTADFETMEIAIKEGGRTLTVSVRMFSPKPPREGA